MTDPFDPAPLVRLAREQHADAPWLADALARCTAGRWESRAYVHFVEPGGPGWAYDESIRLETPDGYVLVDVLRGRRVGGLEFLRRL